MRRAAVLLAFLGVLGTPLHADAKGKEYAKDVEFLLDTLEKKAGHWFELKGIDWKKVSKQFRAEAKKVKTDEEHLVLCSRLVARLRDGHAGIVDSKVKWPDESKGRRFTGPRVHLLTSGEKVFVRAAFGDAAEQGIEVGMEVVEIEREPAIEWLLSRVDVLRDTAGFSTDNQALYAACHRGLAEWEGTAISFDLKEGADRKKVTITRNGGPNYVPIGPVHPPKDLKTTGRQSYGKTAAGFAYVHLRDVPDELPAQIDEALAAVGDAPGLILDMRANGGGGCDHEAVLGRFVPEGKTWRQYESRGARPYVGPVVVIVDAGVVSAGETVAGSFKEDGRGFMIGDSATAGMSSQKEDVEVPSGLFKVHLSVASNKGRFNGGKGIEGIGVPPNEVVPYDPAELLAGVDTQIRRAEELLSKGFPKGAVPYRPPDR
jgi:carboxyl-terminal processing protease